MGANSSLAEEQVVPPLTAQATGGSTPPLSWPSTNAERDRDFSPLSRCPQQGKDVSDEATF